MKPDEIRRKANKIAILIIEGEDALLDQKYNMKEHPFYKYVAEGKNLKRKKEPAALYDWGSLEYSTGNAVRLDSYQGKLSDLDNLKIKANKQKAGIIILMETTRKTSSTYSISSTI